MKTSPRACRNIAFMFMFDWLIPKSILARSGHWGPPLKMGKLLFAARRNITFMLMFNLLNPSTRPARPDGGENEPSRVPKHNFYVYV